MSLNGSSKQRHINASKLGIAKSGALRHLITLLGVAAAIWLQLGAQGFAQAQNDEVRQLVARPDYRARLSHFDEFPVRRGDVVFLGDQLMHFGAWNEFFTGVSVRNRGITGDRADALLVRLQHVVNRGPSAIVLHIGANDIFAGADTQTVLARIEQLLINLREVTPPNRLLVVGLPPLTAGLSRPIREYNEQLRALVLRYGNVYVDIFDPLVGRQGAIYRDYTIDGRILSGRGYRVVAETLLPYLIKIAGEQRQATEEYDRLMLDSLQPAQ